MSIDKQIQDFQTEIQKLKTELEHSQDLSTRLMEASERMDLFQRSLQTLALCKSSKALLHAFVEMVQSVVPLEQYRFFERRVGEDDSVWSLSFYEGGTPEDAITVDGDILEWSLDRTEPCVVPRGESAIQESHLFIPLSLGKNKQGCLVGILHEGQEELSRHCLRMLSALSTEASLMLQGMLCQEKLKRKNQLYLSCLDELPHAIVGVAGNGEMLVFNQKAEHLFGMSPVLVVSENITQVFPRPFAEAVMAYVSQAVKNRRSFSASLKGPYQTPYKQHDVKVHVAPLPDESGASKGALLSFELA